MSKLFCPKTYFKKFSCRCKGVFYIHTYRLNDESEKILTTFQTKHKYKSPEDSVIEMLVPFMTQYTKMDISVEVE